MQHNPASGTLEVSLRVTPTDLERALSRRAKGKVDLERRADIDALITAYLGDVFVVRSGSTARAKLRWVGKEIVSHQIAWLHFEFEVPSKASTVTVRNWVFFELAPRQTNTINVRVGNKRQTLTFSPGAGEGEKRIKLTG